MAGWWRRIRDDSGAMAVMLALSLVPLSIAGLGAVDLTNALSARSQLQDALDAATLAAARLSTKANELTPIGQDHLQRNLAGATNLKLDSSSFAYGPGGPPAVVGDATGHVPTIIAQLVTKGPLSVSAHSEVLSSSSSVEVSLVLDITGSMCQPDCAKLNSLKNAAKSLIDLVVKPPTKKVYTEVALIPYSTGVNLGANARTFRGSVPSTLTFTSATGASRTFTRSTCVTERQEAVPSDSSVGKAGYVGAQYPTNRAAPYDNPCPTAVITPLSSDATALKTAVDAFTAKGSTAGQIGLAWGWYMLSPNFLDGSQSAFPKPGKYFSKPPDRVQKVVVLMTDGMFNTAYCKGVISSDSTDPGAGDPSDHINCKAQADPFTQARALCDKIKQTDVIIYTVGFDFASQTTSERAKSEALMNYCASDPANVYLPDTGEKLEAVFYAIGQDINNLRLTK